MLNDHVSLITDATGDIASVAGWLWQKGWAEKNGGNITVRLDYERLSQSGLQGEGRPYLLQKPFPRLRGQFFLVTGTNTRMRDVAASPRENTLLIGLNDDGTGYHIMSPTGDTLLRPTSELSSHLCIHAMLAEKRPAHMVVMHTHVTELIALTHIRGLCDTVKLNRILLGMHPEARVFVPAGVGFVPYLLPGTTTIGELTVKALSDHEVTLWEKHGVFATGRTPQEAFDIIDLLAKSASIWFLCRSAGYDPEGLTESQLEELAKIKF
ncbi:MAG: rhamnulose-1-phosphate aldolase [Bacteroidales bacterium]